MTRLARIILILGAALSNGCVIPPLVVVTRTAVVRPADSTPVLGDQFTVRVLLEEPLPIKEAVSVRWDHLSRHYVLQIAAASAETPRTFRVARLKGDVYLFQARTSQLKYTLVPVRISKTQEVSFLVCDPSQDRAADYGVTLIRDDESSFGLDLRGDRAGIIGFMAALVETCQPLLQLDTLLIPKQELATAGAAPGWSFPDECIPCPAGEGACVQGSISDPTGAVVTGVLVQLIPPSNKGKGRSTNSDTFGEFFISGTPEGSYALRLSHPGFRNLESRFYARPGFTYLFKSPLVLHVGSVDETIAIDAEPLECKGVSPGASQ